MVCRRFCSLLFPHHLTLSCFDVMLKYPVSKELCPLLGLTAPTYRLTASSSETPSLLSGAAYFPGDPVLHGGIGEVRSVYGKKNAKEECARGVWEVLTGLARKRGVEIEISEEEENGV